MGWRKLGGEEEGEEELGFACAAGGGLMVSLKGRGGEEGRGYLSPVISVM